MTDTFGKGQHGYEIGGGDPHVVEIAEPQLETVAGAPSEIIDDEHLAEVVQLKAASREPIRNVATAENDPHELLAA